MCACRATEIGETLSIEFLAPMGALGTERTFAENPKRAFGGYTLGYSAQGAAPVRTILLGDTQRRTHSLPINIRLKEWQAHPVLGGVQARLIDSVG